MKNVAFRLRPEAIAFSITSAAVMLALLFGLARLISALGIMTVAAMLGAIFICYRIILAILQRQPRSNQPQSENWDGNLPPLDHGNGPDNFPGGSRVPKVPLTPLLTGSAAKHVPSPYVPYAHYHAFAEIESEMRRNVDASRQWRRNFDRQTRY